MTPNAQGPKTNDPVVMATFVKAGLLQTLGMIVLHAEAASRQIILRDELSRRARGASALVLAGDGGGSQMQALLAQAGQMNTNSQAELAGLLDQVEILRKLVGTPAAAPAGAEPPNSTLTN